MTTLFQLLEDHDGSSITVAVSAALTMELSEVAELRRSTVAALQEPLPETFKSTDHLALEHEWRLTLLSVLGAVDTIMAHRLGDGEYDTKSLVTESRELGQAIDYGSEDSSILMVDLESVLDSIKE